MYTFNLSMNKLVMVGLFGTGFVLLTISILSFVSLFPTPVTDDLNKTSDEITQNTSKLFKDLNQINDQIVQKTSELFENKQIFIQYCFWIYLVFLLFIATWLSLISSFPVHEIRITLTMLLIYVVLFNMYTYIDNTLAFWIPVGLLSCCMFVYLTLTSFQSI